MSSAQRKHVLARLAKGTGSALLTPGEVAILFGVDSKSVTRWALGGRIQAEVTDGGHHRFEPKVIWDLLNTEDDLFKPEAVAAMFRVSVKTVGRWNLPSIKTPGGHTRFLASGIQEYLKRQD